MQILKTLCNVANLFEFHEFHTFSELRNAQIAQNEMMVNEEWNSVAVLYAQVTKEITPANFYVEYKFSVNLVRLLLWEWKPAVAAISQKPEAGWVSTGQNCWGTAGISTVISTRSRCADGRISGMFSGNMAVKYSTAYTVEVIMLVWIKLNMIHQRS